MYRNFHLFFFFWKGVIYLNKSSLVLDISIFKKFSIWSLDHHLLRTPLPHICNSVFYHIVILFKYYSEAFCTITSTPVSELTAQFTLGVRLLHGCRAVLVWGTLGCIGNTLPSSFRHHLNFHSVPVFHQPTTLPPRVPTLVAHVLWEQSRTPKLTPLSTEQHPLTQTLNHWAGSPQLWKEGQKPAP